MDRFSKPAAPSDQKHLLGHYFQRHDSSKGVYYCESYDETNGFKLVNALDDSEHQYAWLNHFGDMGTRYTGCIDESRLNPLSNCGMPQMYAVDTRLAPELLVAKKMATLLAESLPRQVAIFAYPLYAKQFIQYLRDAALVGQR